MSSLYKTRIISNQIPSNMKKNIILFYDALTVSFIGNIVSILMLFLKVRLWFETDTCNGL